MPSAMVRAADTGRAARRAPRPRGVESRLARHDLDAGLHAFAAIATPAISPPPPIGTTRRVEVGRRLEHLERDRALAGDHVGVVVGVDEGEPASPASACACAAAPSRSSPSSTTRAPQPRVFSTFTKAWARHHDRGRDAEPAGVVGDALGVVAGRHGDDAAAAGLLGELDQPVVGAALLERGGVLEVLEFQPQLAARDLGERPGQQAGRALDLAAGAPPQPRRRRARRSSGKRAGAGRDPALVQPELSSCSAPPARRRPSRDCRAPRRGSPSPGHAARVTR